jgi:1,2-diacylglycerol 3-alpha-glucosyltransferase
MRIAFFSEGFDPFTNGVVTLVKSYRKALEAAGHEVVIFTPEHDEQPDFEEGVVRLPSLTFHREFYPVLRPFANIRKRFTAGEFDVIHSHHPFSCGLLAERLAHKHGLPLVYTFHTLLTHQAQHVPGPAKLAELGMMQVIRRHCEHADCVTASTHVMKAWLQEHKIETPIAIVRPEPPEMECAPDARSRLRSAWDVNDATAVAFCASRLSPEKGLDLLLDAVALLPEGLDFKLIIAGSGPDEDELERMAERLQITDRVAFIGEVPYAEMADYYAAADIFAFPSRNDTLGMVVLEALASGLPVLAINENGPSEVVRHGIDGCLVNYDPASFSTALERLATDREWRTQLARQAKIGCDLFCRPGTAQGLLEAYGIAKEEKQRRASLPPISRTVRRVIRTPG